MRKFKRQEALLMKLQKRKLPLSLNSLAREHDCSVKTIRRDIDELVMERSAPWFISNGEVFLDLARQTQIELKGYWFTSEELFSLLTLYSIVDELSEGLLAEHFLEIKKRILKLLGPIDKSEALIQNLKIIPIAQPRIKSSTLNNITAAISKQQRLVIEFWNRHNNQITTREVSPYQLVRYRDRWFLDGYCHQRNALRSFSLEAILELSSLPQKILSPDFKTLNRYFQSSYGIFSGRANKLAILNFSAYQARWIKDQQWHPKQTAKWLEDGRYQLTLPYKEDLELIQDVLKYGAEVEVISPPELREKVRDKLKETLKIYE